MLLSGDYRNGHARQDYGRGPCASIKQYYTIPCERVEATSNRLRLGSFLSLLCSLLLLQGSLLHAEEHDLGPALIVAQAADGQQPPAVEVQSAGEQGKVSPEEKMRRRFPHPVKVGDLIGLPVLDWDDVTIGHVRQVVRTPEGKISARRDLWRIVWMGPAARAGAHRGGRNIGAPIGRARHVARGIRQGADLVRFSDDARCAKRDDLDCGHPTLMGC